MRSALLFLLLLWMAPSVGRASPSLPDIARDATRSLSMERLRGEAEGAWIEMAVTLAGIPVGPYLRFCLGEREAAGVWMELWISQRPGSGSQAVRLLMSPGRDGGPEIVRALGRTFGGAITELEIAAGEGGGPRAAGAPAAAGNARDDAAGGVSEGNEPLLTPAGSFLARKVELRDRGRRTATLWYADELPLLGIAKIEFADAIGMEVHAHGTSCPFLFPTAKKSDG